MTIRKPLETGSARILDGRELAGRIRQRTAEGVVALGRQGIDVRLDVVTVGEPEAGELFTRSQRRQCDEIGIQHRLHALGADATEDVIRATIEELNRDPDVTGIMLSLPLPEHIDTPALQYCIDPYKDVEGVNPSNVGMLFYGSPIIAPCTALAVWEILKSLDEPIRGRHAVVVGQSRIVGRPVTLFLLQEEATVTACNVHTVDLVGHTRAADIIVVATGVPGLIGRKHVKPGAIVIDVGINRVADVSSPGGTKVVGDVRFDEVIELAGTITPVPGGVGPVTVAVLLASAVEAARKQREGRRIR